MSMPVPTIPGTLCGLGPTPSPVNCHSQALGQLRGKYGAWAVLREPEAMRSEITIDAVTKLFFYEEPGIKHRFAADRVLDPEQKFLGINKGDALVLVVEREQYHVVRRGDLEEGTD